MVQVWYSVVQFGTVWYSVVQCGTVWYSLVQCGASVVQEWYLAIKIRNHQATELLSISTPYYIFGGHPGIKFIRVSRPAN